MNREIKFRAWDKDEKQMMYPSILGIGFENFAWRHGRDYLHNCQDWGNEDGFIYDPILMQYTGLKDKNGKEIYEGDLVKVQDPYNGNWSTDCATVIFSNDYVGGWVISNGKQNLNLGTRQKYLEVVGNIFENPELLK
jgi:uncharacterized phage protein (TIGR01671 family)